MTMQPRVQSYLYVPLCTVSLLWGCTGVDDKGSTPFGAAKRLPDPIEWRVPPTSFTSEQWPRQTEVDELLVEQYRDLRIVQTTQGYSGDIIDWVDPDTIPGADLEPPPPPWTEEDLVPSPGAEFARTELELYPELRGPEGTTPIHRPDFSTYVLGLTDVTSLQDYLENYQVTGQPSGQKRLYAGIIQVVASKAMAGVINQFASNVEAGSLSLIEMAAFCRGANEPTTLEQVGAAVSLDRVNYTSTKVQPRIRIEYFTQGPNTTGDDKGGWDGPVKGFVPYPGRPYGPNTVVPVSTLTPRTQQEHRFDISQDASGNWWIAHNGHWLGHYPARLFDMLNISACRTAWYGEVYDPTPTQWTSTEMGSGQFATGPEGSVAYVKDPTYRDIWGGNWFPDINLDMTRFDTECYTRTPLMLTSTGRIFYLGGPGGKAPKCK